MNRQRVLVGSLIVVLCVLLFLKERWFLENTAKGRRLHRWFGPTQAPRVFRGLIVGGMIFGGLLASGVIRPIQW